MYRSLIVLALLLTVAAGPITSPAPGPLRIVGSESSGGCIAGAERLPASGEGFETIHLGYSSFWGAPPVIERIGLLGKQAHAAGLADFYVEDISHPRGGPMPGGHVSHQLGLDVDVVLDPRPKAALTQAARETVEVISLVRADRRGIDPGRWTPAVAALIKLAAGLPDVDRVLVNPAIKRQLCNEVTGDRTWLRLIRPWYGHAAHMHVSFRCPVGQVECVPVPPPPAGDGCDATLQWWFDQLDVPPKPPGPARPPRPLPAACKAIMTGGG